MDDVAREVNDEDRRALRAYFHPTRYSSLSDPHPDRTRRLDNVWGVAILVVFFVVLPLVAVILNA